MLSQAQFGSKSEQTVKQKAESEKTNEEKHGERAQLFTYVRKKGSSFGVVLVSSPLGSDASLHGTTEGKRDEERQWMVEVGEEAEINMEIW